MIPVRVPNPFSEPVSVEQTCRIAERLQIQPILLFKLIRAQQEIPFDLHVFSGARSRRHQERISATPFDRSTHANETPDGCARLATGVDVQPVSPGIRSSAAAVAQMGAAFTRQGLRWGGGAPVDDTGIPVGNERWHVDLGPRAS